MLRNKKIVILFLFALALLLRLGFVPNPGFEADVAFWKGWGLAAADKGVVWSMLNTNNNYPTPFAYTLGAMVGLYRLLGGNPYNFYDYWNDTNVRFLLVAKLPSIIADFGIAAIILWVGRRFGTVFRPLESESEPESKKKKSSLLRTLFEGETFWVLLAGLYLLNPVSIMDGAWWGQVDSVGVIFFLLAVVAILFRKPFLCGLIFMLSMMTKLQNMIYGPLLFVFIWNEFGFSAVLSAFWGAVVGFFGFNIEFFLQKQMPRVISSLVDNYDYFPYMSLHAYNIWWIISGGNGMGVSDKLLTIGVLTAKSLGTILFSGLYLLAVLHVSLATILRLTLPKHWKRKPKLTQTHSEQENITSSGPSSKGIFGFFLSLVIVNAGFFFFQTQSHERYAFPLSAFLLFLAPFLRGYKRILFLAAYVGWSVLYFLNLHTAFAANYPNNVFQFLRFLYTPPLTNFLSLLLLASFGLFLFFFSKTIKPLPFFISGLFVLSLVILENFSFLMKKPIYLSSMRPFIARTGYSKIVTDMPANAGFGPKSWTFLSTQYTFYRHGIGAHANSELTFDIGRRFSKLQTDYGIDTTAGNQASAFYQIWGDQTLLFQSQKMGRFDMPKHIEVNLVGVKYLTLKTLDAGDGNRDDHTDWLDTKILP